MKPVVYLSIAFDPRELWFQAGFARVMQMQPQWSEDPDSAARALERFLKDDNDFTEVHVSARKVISESSKVVVNLDKNAWDSLRSFAQQKQTSVEVWLRDILQSPQVEIQTPGSLPSE